MDRRLISKRLNLCRQYKHATGENYLFFNRESTRLFEEFYIRRSEIGKIIFYELINRGYDLNNPQTLELMKNIYDSIGINFNTSVIDHSTNILRDNYQDNLPTQFDRYDFNILDNKIDIKAIEEITGVEKSYHVNHNISSDDFSTFIMLNPKNKNERNMMAELLKSSHNSIVGYYGDLSDLDMLTHQEEIQILESSTNSKIINNLSLNNSYAYILTNISKK